MLTARGDDIDRIVGLEIGADDYLAKPCNPRELIARLRAILRRVQKIPSQRPVIDPYGNIRIDCAKRIATHNKIELMELTNAEFNILEMLIKSPGQALSKEELTEYALGRKYTAYDRSVRTCMSVICATNWATTTRVRSLIKTVRGFGYMFNA